MIIGGSLKAQNDSTYIYQSFFGNDSTRINLYHVITDGDWNYTFTIYNKDTIKINDTKYFFVEPKELISVAPYWVEHYNSTDTIYFREDIQKGRLYLYMKNEEIDNELLLCDMSLEIGDSFTTPVFYNHMWYEEYYEDIIVNDREVLTECLGLLTSFDRRMAKAILSKRRSYAMFIIDFVYSDEEFVVYTFTEGIFPPIMPEISYGENNNVLTCQYKDGELAYLSPYFSECLPKCTMSINDIFDDKALTISPTLLSNGETISIKADSEIKEVKMIDMLGRKVNVSVNQTGHSSCQININQKCNSGIYIIIVETQESSHYEKVIIRG